MQLINGEILASPSDLTQAADCEFAVLRRLDGKLGWAKDVEIPDNPLLIRAAGLGDKHEQRVLTAYEQRFGAGVRYMVDPFAQEPDLAFDTIRIMKGWTTMREAGGDPR